MSKFIKQVCFLSNLKDKNYNKNFLSNKESFNTIIISEFSKLKALKSYKFYLFC